MTTSARIETKPRWNPWRVAGWTTAGLLLALPLVAMQFTNEVRWSPADFVFAGVLIGGTGLVFEVAARRSSSLAYRAAAGIALGMAFLTEWANAAVGIVGSENNPANWMFDGVLAVGIVGALAARFRPAGLSRALVATACAQVLAGAIALIGNMGTDGRGWPRDVIGFTVVSTAAWLVSAALFRRAAKTAKAV